MKKHLAKLKALRVLLLAAAVTLAAGIFPWAVVHAEPNSSVTDYLKQNEDKDKEKEQKPADQKKEPAEAEADRDSPVVGLTAWDYIKTGLALLFVIALIYGMVKLVNNRNRVTQRGKLMQNMGGLSLGQQKSIQLVKIGERFYLVGVGEDVRLLKELTDPEELDQFSDYYSEGEDSGHSSPLLKLVDGFKNRKTNPYESQEKPEEFGDMFKNKLTEIENERKRQLQQLTEKERNRNE